MTIFASARERRPARRMTGAARLSAMHEPNRMITNTTTTSRSTEMYTMYEALARERLRPNQRDAEQLRVARELVAARRWRRLELRARAAHRRHVLRVN